MAKKYCIMDDCDQPVHCKSLCSRHYAWERWHAQRNHGFGYFAGYVARYEELTSRGRGKLAAARPKLRRVS